MDPASLSLGDARAVHSLMSGLIDYAGLFPPARLPMNEAVAAYAAHLAGRHAWMLGRFIVPVSRLDEFAAAASPALPRDRDSEPWPISAIVEGDLGKDLDRIASFNAEHARREQGLAAIDAIEIKVPASAMREGPDTAFIDRVLDTLPDELYPFFELPLLPATPGSTPPDLRGCVAALSGADGAAKIRTGGITADATPPSRAIADFLCACAAGDVPFKATAGLHHAVRAAYPLTYEPECPRAVMHGFLNLFFAAGAVFAGGADAVAAADILEESDARAFKFSDRSITRRGHPLDTAQIERTRLSFALSYGSCSFDEPCEDLARLGLI